MSSPPVVSVAIPCFDHGCFLAEAVGSVFKQSLADWECIIINDGPKDNTADVATRLVQTQSARTH